MMPRPFLKAELLGALSQLLNCGEYDILTGDEQKGKQ